MVVGDIINEVGALSAQLNFQPASGVEVLISSAGNYSAWVFLTDGTLDGFICNTGSGQPEATNANIKAMINNTHYLKIEAKSGYSGNYTGIQIK
jgi:hypothetical protein